MSRRLTPVFLDMERCKFALIGVIANLYTRTAMRQNLHTVYPYRSIAVKRCAPSPCIPSDSLTQSTFSAFDAYNSEDKDCGMSISPKPIVAKTLEKFKCMNRWRREHKYHSALLDATTTDAACSGGVMMTIVCFDGALENGRCSIARAKSF